EARWPKLAPLVRGQLAQPTGDPDRGWRRMLLDFRTSPEMLALLTAPACARLSQQGPLTPDHVLRTKAYPLFLSEPAVDDPERVPAGRPGGADHRRGRRDRGRHRRPTARGRGARGASRPRRGRPPARFRPSDRRPPRAPADTPRRRDGRSLRKGRAGRRLRPLRWPGYLRPERRHRPRRSTPRVVGGDLSPHPGG